MEKEEKKWKNQSIVIVNSKSKTRRPLNLEQILQPKKEGKEDKKNSDINNRDVCQLCNRHVKTGVEYGIHSRWLHYKFEGITEETVVKEYPHETYYICKNDKEQRQLEVAIREFRKQLQ